MSGSLPSFSVVVPTYRRPAQLAGCLAALAAVDYPGDRLEVIVVDDGGETPASSLGAARDALNLTLRRTPNQGPAAARNVGARASRHEFLAFTDDDCWPDRRWLRALARRVTEEPRRAVGGRTVNAVRGSACAEASQFIVDCVYAFYNADPDRPRFLISNNMAVSSDVFGEVGGFDPEFRTSEDREFCDRLLLGAHGMTYASDAIVRHSHELGIADFWRQHFGYGRGAWRFHRERARRGSGCLRNEIGFYATVPKLARLRLRRMPPAAAMRLLALLAVWQAANAAGFALEGATWR